MRKKACLLFAVVLFIFVLGSCAKERSASPEPSEVPPPSGSPGETDTPQPSDQEPSEPPVEDETASVGERTLEKSYELEAAEGRKFRGELYVSVPEITSDEYPEGAAAVSEYYEARREKFREGFEAELDEFAGYEMGGFGSLPISLDVSYKTEYNRGGILSFSFVIASYTGGAHDMAVIESETFDLRDGTRVVADSLFTVGEEVYAARIKEEILRQMDDQAKSGESPYYENYAELMEQSFNKESFILTEDGLCYYYQIYDIAPYAGGSFRFTIPYEELSDILDPKYGLGQ